MGPAQEEKKEKKEKKDRVAALAVMISHMRWGDGVDLLFSCDRFDIFAEGERLLEGKG